MRIRVDAPGAGRRSSAQAPRITPPSFSSPSSMVVKSYEALPFAAMPLGAGGRELESNRAFILRTGMTSERARHGPVHYTLRPDTDEHTLPRIRHAGSCVQMFSGVSLCHRFNGAPCWNDLTVMPDHALTESDAAKVALFRDVTALPTAG